MGGFSNDNQDYTGYKEIFSNISINSSTSYVSSNGSAGTNKKNSSSDAETVNLDEKTSNNSGFSDEFLDIYFKRFGDANGDGKVDKSDVSVIHEILAGKGEGSYDLDGDGEFTISDASLLNMYLDGESITGKMLNYENNENISTLILETSGTESSDEIKQILSNMTEAEYKEYVADLKKQYDEKIASYEQYKKELTSLYKEPMDEIDAAIHKIVGIQYGTPVFASDAEVEKILGMPKSEAQATYDAMKSEIAEVDYMIEQLKSQRDNCDYYGLIYTKKYIDYDYSISEEDFNNFVKYGRVADTMNQYNIRYSYSQYVSECKANGVKVLNPLQFNECVHNAPRTGPLQSNTTNLEDLKVLDSIYYLKEFAPDYYKTYCFLYEQDPDKASQYIDDMKDEIFKLHGQYIANNQLSMLDEKDGDSDFLGAIANNLNISVSGIVNGMVKFAEGGVYSLEALAAAIGLTDGTRQMSAYEYAELYKLYALMSQENKEKLGLIVKNENTGEYENASSDFVIDFSKEYSGLFLDKKYQISEGIGTMLPSIALSFVNPMAGTISIGISSGGNAYHGAMLQGHEKYSSIMYGVFTGVSNAFLERKIGGLVGLSNTQVTSLKTYFISIGKETAMGQVSTLMDDLYRASYMGEGFPTTKEGWQEYFERKGEIAVQSAVTAGIVNLPALGTAVYKKRKFDNIMRNAGMEDSQIKEAIEAFRKANPSLANMSDDEIKVNYLNSTASIYSAYRSAKIKSIAAAAGVAEEVATVMFHTGLNSADAQALLDGGSNGIWVSGKGTINLSNAEQWESFSKYIGSGMTEHEALAQMLKDYDAKYVSEGWLEPGDIESRVRKAYDSLPESDKANLSYDEFLKIKLQLIKYDPQVHTPARYAIVQQQMKDSGSVKLVWSAKDLNGLLSGFFGNGIGRGANGTQESATFAIPSSQLVLPDDFDSWDAPRKAEYLGKTLGLSSSNFKSGAFEIEIDESVYGDSWRYSDPYTQGSNQEYVPGMYTSSGLSEVVIPRIDDVVEGGIPANIQKQIAAGNTETAYQMFFDGISNGTIKLKPGVTIRRL